MPCTRQLNERRSRLVANHPVSGSFFYLGSPSFLPSVCPSPCLQPCSVFCLSPRARVDTWQEAAGIWAKREMSLKNARRFGGERERSIALLEGAWSRVFGEGGSLAKLVPSTGFGRYELVSVGFVLERSLGYLYREIQFNCLSLVESSKAILPVLRWEIAGIPGGLRVTLNFNVWTLRQSLCCDVLRRGDNLTFVETFCANNNHLIVDIFIYL